MAYALQTAGMHAMIQRLGINQLSSAAQLLASVVYFAQSALPFVYLKTLCLGTVRNIVEP